jgi:dynein heavy chain, axonemal
LASGERMSLSDQCMNVMLEVDDLTAASPATVSRCGMVFVPDDLVLWHALVNAWFKALPSILTGPFYARERGERIVATQNAASVESEINEGEEKVLGETGLNDMMEQLRDLFHQHMDPCLKWLAQNAVEPVPATLHQRVHAVCTWVQVVLHPACGWDPSAGHGSAEQIAVCNVFAFAVVWGLGGALQGDSRAAWDTHIRAQFNGQAMFPAGAGLVFDYCLNPAHNYSFQVRSHARDFSARAAWQYPDCATSKNHGSA